MIPRWPDASFAEDLPAAIRWVGYTLFVGFFGLFFGFNGVSADAVVTLEFVASVSTTLPFVGVILYSGFWLDRAGIRPGRYPRIARWFAVGLAGFLLLNAAMIAVWPADTTYNNLSWALFAAAVGGAGGLGMGIFEARAITQAIEAERNRIGREEMAQRNEQLERFAGIVSHDLRNPLNVASGRLALARQECESEHLDAVATAHDRMASIVDRTLTLARSGRIIGDVEPADLATLAEDCWSAVTTADATLRIEGTTTVEADPHRLRHLFENLFRNAVEHAGRDAVVRVGTTEDGFYIADDGPGIPESNREEVFDATFSTSDDGTGLGLGIVEQVVEAHGWGIHVTEGDDGGARFDVRVAADAEDGTDADTDAPPAGT